MIKSATPVLFLLVCCLFLAGSPGFSAQSSNRAESLDPMSQKWLRVLDSGDFMESWNAASSLLQKKVSKAAWDMTLIPMRMHTGRCLSRHLVAAQFVAVLPGFPKGNYAILKYVSAFTDQKQMIETLTLTKENDGKWKVAAYDIKARI